MGGGGAHITSRGIVLASRFNVMSQRHRPCESQLAAEDMRELDHAVSSADASAWKSSYVPDGDNGCCDRFRWSLLLYRRGTDGTGNTYGTHWYGGNEKHLPGDLAALRAIILAIQKTVLRRCTQQASRRRKKKSVCQVSPLPSRLADPDTCRGLRGVIHDHASIPASPLARLPAG